MTAPRIQQREVTRIPPEREAEFREWVRRHRITDLDDPRSFYDYRGAFMDSLEPEVSPVDSLPHWPDTYKQHGHPTFSVESKYSAGVNDGGRWEGERYVPATKPQKRKLSKDIVDLVKASTKQGGPSRVISGPIEPVGIPRESAVDLAADNWKARAVLAAMARNKGDEAFTSDVAALQEERLPERRRNAIANIAKATAIGASLPISGPAAPARMAAMPVLRYLGSHAAIGAATNVAPNLIGNLIEGRPKEEVLEQAKEDAKFGAGVGLAVPGAMLALPEVLQSAKTIAGSKPVRNFLTEESGEIKPPKPPKAKPAEPRVALEGTPFPAYSRLETAIRGAPFERGTAEQWKAALQKNVAAGERSYTGMDDYLAANAGKVIHRDEVLGQFSKGRVKLGTTVRGKPQFTEPGQLEWEEHNDLSTEPGTFIATPPGVRPEEADEFYFYGPDPERDNADLPWRASTPDDSELFATPEEARAWAEAQAARPRNGPTKPTKFETYQLNEFGEETRRGGQRPPGYHEVVLTSESAPYEPALKPVKVDEAGYTVEPEPHPDGTTMYFVRDPNGRAVAYADTEDEALDWRNRYIELERRRKVPRAGRQDFTQPGHFPEKNPIVHYRANDRVAPNGEKVRFIEEIQSDWHQQGRERGYQTADLDERINAARREWQEAETAYATDPNALERRNNAKEKYENLQRTKTVGVPDAPFKKTDEWMELAMKDIIDKAVKDGVDRVAWTTGAQQNRRWSLSTAVDEIEYNPATGKFVALKGGRAVHQGTYDPKALPDVMGREASEKLLQTPPNNHGNHALRGPELEVEGRGMRSAYDEILPKVVQNYAKKRGVQIDIEPMQVFQSKAPQYPQAVGEPGVIPPGAGIVREATRDDLAAEFQALEDRRANGEQLTANEEQARNALNLALDDIDDGGETPANALAQFSAATQHAIHGNTELDLSDFLTPGGAGPMRVRIRTTQPALPAPAQPTGARFIVPAESPANWNGNADEELTMEHLRRAREVLQETLDDDIGAEDDGTLDALNTVIARARTLGVTRAMESIGEDGQNAILFFMEAERAPTAGAAPQGWDVVGTATPGSLDMTRSGPPVPMNPSIRVAPFREAAKTQPLQPLWALLAAAGAGSARRVREEQR